MRTIERGDMKGRSWLPLTLLVLASLACSVFGRAERAIEVGKEAATKVSEVATTVGEEGLATLVPESAEEGGVAEGASDEEPAPPAIDADALAGLDSYRTRFSAAWKPAEGEPEIIAFEEAHTRDPRARHFVMEGSTEDQSLEIVQIEDRSWMCGGGVCSEMEADPDELAASFSDAAMFDPGDMTDDANASFVGREEINGIQTRHYSLKLTPAQVALMAEGDVSDVVGDAWIADEPGLPKFAVRFEMSWAEKRQDLMGEASFVYETYDVNAPFTIEPPEGADESGLPDDVPVYPNGEETFSMADMTTFDSPDGVTTVADFYRERLPAEGWTAESDDDMETMVQQVWKKGDRMLTLVVTEQDGGSTAMITLEEGD
jgi:hypothetical protein